MAASPAGSGGAGSGSGGSSCPSGSSGPSGGGGGACSGSVPGGDGPGYDVFLSHSPAQATLCNALYAALTSPPHNLRVFHIRDGHLHTAAAMHHHCTSARVFLCIVSEEYAQSGFCRGELNVAWQSTQEMGHPSWEIVNGGSDAPHAPGAHGGGPPAWTPRGCPGGWEPSCFSRDADALPPLQRTAANNLSVVYQCLAALDVPWRDARGPPDTLAGVEPQLTARQQEAIPHIVADVRALLEQPPQPSLPATPQPLLPSAPSSSLCSVQ